MSVMATLLHFLGSLAIALSVGFMLLLSALVGGLSSLAIFKGSPARAIAQSLYQWMREFLAAATVGVGRLRSLSPWAS